MEAFYLRHGHGPRADRMAVCRRPPGPVRGGVLYLHPLAEEMNKARRMAALQAKALAELGYIVLSLDLLGCGDSAGDFSDAGWRHWLDDASLGLRWLRAQTSAPLWAWGLRAGALLAAATAAAPNDRPDHLLLWQPPASGKLVLQQFLRLRAASAALDGASKGVLEGLRRDLAAGQVVEVAGYGLSPELARGLEAATMEPPAGTGRVCLIEQDTGDGQLSPIAQRCAGQWSDQGWSVQAHAVAGPAFWQTTEVETAPLWLEATCRALGAETAA